VYVGERIAKIGQYLTKILTRVSCLPFLTHGVYPWIKVMTADQRPRSAHVGRQPSVDIEATVAPRMQWQIGNCMVLWAPSIATNSRLATTNKNTHNFRLLTLWRSLLPYGDSYKASSARQG